MGATEAAGGTVSAAPARAPEAGRAIVWAVSLLIAAKIALIFWYALTTRFVPDEFGQVGYAKYIFNGLFDTVEPTKAVGFALFYKLAHLIGWDAVSIVLTARVQTALVACGMLGLVYCIARTLGQDRLRALAIVLVLLCFSNFVERSFRTISEPLAVLFALAALAVVLASKSHSIRAIAIAGFLSGLSFLTTQKAVYFNVALGVALLADAASARDFSQALRRGFALVVGWLVAVAAYCLLFGGLDPVPVARSLIFGPMEVASRGGVEYGGLRGFVLQTLSHNPILYVFAFTGLLLALLRIKAMGSSERIALVFTALVTILVFAHDQPWPYVFLMAQPFLALWTLEPLHRLAADRRLSLAATIVLAMAIPVSFARNASYLQLSNASQLSILSQAEALTPPDSVYFDGIDMLPNRREPSTLWLDMHYILKTLEEKENSEAFRIFLQSPPRTIIWSYRMDNIHQVVSSLIDRSYVSVGPNVRIVGRQLLPGVETAFRVPVEGSYRLYDAQGRPIEGNIVIDGVAQPQPVFLKSGMATVRTPTADQTAFLLLDGSYEGKLSAGPDDETIFNGVYD